MIRRRSLSLACLAIGGGTHIDCATAAAPTYRLSFEERRTGFEAYEALLRRHGLPASVRAIAVDITAEPGGDTMPHARKLHLIDDWQLQVARLLQDEDFAVVPAELVEQGLGFAPDEMRRRLAEEFPFARRAEIEATLGRVIIFTADVQPDECYDTGAFGANVFVTYPTERDRSGFGSILLVMVALGACAGENPRAARRLGRLVRLFRDEVPRILARR